MLVWRREGSAGADGGVRLEIVVSGSENIWIQVERGVEEARIYLCWPPQLLCLTKK